MHRPEILGCTHGARWWWRHRPGHVSLHTQIQGSNRGPEREGYMRLVMATADFLVAGRPFAGFPLLLNEDGWPMEPAHSFLWQALITHGGVDRFADGVDCFFDVADYAAQHTDTFDFADTDNFKFSMFVPAACETTYLGGADV